MNVLLGTSGWQYKSWKGPVYKNKPQRTWLEQYTEMFDTVEVNNAFYRLPERSVFESWRDNTPDGFIVAVKCSRFLTHIKRLKDPEEPVERFVTRAEGLGEKLGPVLVQLPPSMTVDVKRLKDCLSLFPNWIKIAVEFRHDSWYIHDVRKVLEKAGAALCFADSPQRKTPLWKTTDWGYLRFHEGRANPKPCYGKQALRTWAERLASVYSGDDVYVYFNNDTNVCAVRNAGEFAKEIERVKGVCSKAPLNFLPSG